MGKIINAGSENKGGTFEQAKINAEEWLLFNHEEGFLEVEMQFVKQCKDGNFQFDFKHTVTQKVVSLVIHGFTEEECKKLMFDPRVYWDGSSSATPKIEDWLVDGFKYRIEYYRS